MDSLDTTPPAELTGATRAAGTVRIIQSVRHMNCYTVTEGELKSISLANGLAVFCFSMGSAFLTFGVDVAKDIALSPEVPQAAIFLDSVMKPASFVVSVAFFAGGVWALFWRRGMLRMIRTESRSKT